jgi:HAE1 family hydrophobic/amphiphilic exporter-1
VESFCQISGEFLVQIELPKDASLEQSNFMAQRQKLFNTQKYVKSLITKVGQTSEGMAQSTAYKSEIDVKMIDQKTEQMILTSMPPE